MIMRTLKRDIYDKLMQWKESSERKPLILQGARQVGKTFILKYFGEKNYENVAHYDFELDKKLNDIFEKSLEPDRIISDLSLYSGHTLEQEKTLIIFDEVQNSPNAITSLKYFNEIAPRYHIVASGSFLGFANTSAPVGNVTYKTLYPMTFDEFLSGLGENNLRGHLNKKTDYKKLNEALHKKLIGLLKQYMYVGGMPEVVSDYVDKGNYRRVRRKQNDLITAYKSDFSKYSSKVESIKISRVWDSIPRQLAKENKNFIYKDIENKKVKGSKYRDSIDWLLKGGIIIMAFQTETPELPLSAYSERNIFKIYVFDVGLLGALLNIEAKIILDGSELFSKYNGVFCENFVVQELTAHGTPEPYYWVSGNEAEVDFLIEKGGFVVPFEVKSGFNLRAKSLKVYVEEYSPSKVVRTSLKNFNNSTIYYDLPLYAISQINRI